MVDLPFGDRFIDGVQILRGKSRFANVNLPQLRQGLERNQAGASNLRAGNIEGLQRSDSKHLLQAGVGNGQRGKPKALQSRKTMQFLQARIVDQRTLKVEPLQSFIRSSCASPTFDMPSP